jgi:hypothetical protein
MRTRETTGAVRKENAVLYEVHTQVGSRSSLKDVTKRAPSQREQRPMGVVSILSILPEREEAGD